MGIPIIPPTEYNNNCPAVFGVDLTPTILYASFSGIIESTHAFWRPTPSGNGTYALASLAFCRWEIVGPQIQVQLAMNLPGTQITLKDSVPPGRTHFTGQDPLSPTYLMTNVFTAPAIVPYWDGHVVIWYVGSSPKPTAYYFLDLMNIVPDPNTHHDHSSNSLDAYFTHINRLPDNSHIKAKITYP